MITTEVEVIAQSKKTLKCYSSTMPINQWYALEKKPDFYYSAYQIGYYQNSKKINVKV